MAIMKCKMCGGALEVTDNQTVCDCEYCGTTQTTPRLTDDRKANLYDRANHFRRNNDFDKAMGIYEQILNEDNTDAEAYWSLVLCRYGIEYVEDPANHKRIPTVNRAQYTSIFADEDYKSAIQHADVYQKSIYEEEARAIDEIQKGILEISQKEEPFDVFICYKESDNNGRRTQDSVLANDLYHQLTQEGFKVFFSRITLEDKLGTAYEPYIFAALNSSKVMVVLGTKPGYFNAVWVKNEWSRYLALVKNSNGKKMLIPAYRDMDPYDLPEEFSHLQAQDMSKLGFMQDLIRGIKKILSVDQPQEVAKEAVVINGVGSNASIEPLLKRAFMFLEDGNWQEADEYCEKVLDMDPENGEAYLGKLMSELRISSKDFLKHESQTFDNNNNYKKAYRFGDDSIKELLDTATKTIIYNSAVEAMNSADSEESFKNAAEIFSRVKTFSDSEAKINECLEKAEKVRKDAILADGIRYKCYNNVDDLEKAIEIFTQVIDWKNSRELIESCEARICEIKDETLYNAITLKNDDSVYSLERAVNELGKIKEWKNASDLMDECNNRITEINETEEKKRRKEELLIKQVKKKMARRVVVIISVIAIFSVFAVVLNAVIIPIQRANNAIVAVKNGNVGDTLQFGGLKWKVLAKEKERALIITENSVCESAYNEVWKPITWSECTLRGWLNNEFYNGFNSFEKSLILTTRLQNMGKPEYKTSDGIDTDDKIFLLSIDEVNKYFSSDSERSIGAWWWLRSPGRYSRYTAVVKDEGSIGLSGCHVSSFGGAVRPAMWISLE